MDKLLRELVGRVIEGLDVDGQPGTIWRDEDAKKRFRVKYGISIDDLDEFAQTSTSAAMDALENELKDGRAFVEGVVSMAIRSQQIAFLLGIEFERDRLSKQGS